MPGTRNKRHRGLDAQSCLILCHTKAISVYAWRQYQGIAEVTYLQSATIFFFNWADWLKSNILYSPNTTITTPKYYHIYHEAWQKSDENYMGGITLPNLGKIFSTVDIIHYLCHAESHIKTVSGRQHCWQTLSENSHSVGKGFALIVNDPLLNGALGCNHT